MVNMNFYINLLNNREKAIIIWILLLLILALIKKDIRTIILKAIPSILKTLFSKKVIAPLATMIAYVALMIVVFYKIGFWDISMLFTTIAWFLGTAFVVWINVDEVNKNKEYFRKVMLDNFKLAATIGLLGFIINLHVFSLAIELIILPVLSVICIIIEYSKIKKEYSQVSKVLNPILAIAGFYLLASAIFAMVGDFRSFLNMDNLLTFLLPPALTFVYLPFIYLLALYVAYNNIFVFLDVWVKKRNRELAKFAKRKIFCTYFANLRKLNNFSRKNTGNLMKLNSKQDLLSIIQLFENSKTHDEN